MVVVLAPPPHEAMPIAAKRIANIFFMSCTSPGADCGHGPYRVGYSRRAVASQE